MKGGSTALPCMKKLKTYQCIWITSIMHIFIHCETTSSRLSWNILQFFIKYIYIETNDGCYIKSMGDLRNGRNLLREHELLIFLDRLKLYQINVTCVNLEVMRELICTVKLWICKSIFLLIFTLVSAQRQIRPKPDLFPDTIALKNIFAELNKKSWQVLIFLFPHNKAWSPLYWFFRTSPSSPVVFRPPQHQFLQNLCFPCAH